MWRRLAALEARERMLMALKSSARYCLLLMSVCIIFAFHYFIDLKLCVLVDHESSGITILADLTMIYMFILMYVHVYVPGPVEAIISC